MVSERRDDAEAWIEEALRRYGVDEYIAPARAVRVIEFTLVGVTGVVVNVAAFLGVVDALHAVGLSGLAYYLGAGAVAFYLSVSWNFVLNRAITFDRPDGHVPSQYVRYLAVHVVGFVVYIAILGVTLDVFALPFLISDLIAVTLGGLVNFAGAEIYAFSMHRRGN